MKTTAYGTKSPTSEVEKLTIDRREPTEYDVVIEVVYCGICHSDIHTAKGDWGEVAYPCVPGHEIVGIVTQVGSSVTTHKIGDSVGVGCMVNACRECDTCKAGYENYCDKVVWTYSSVDSIDGTDTKGGYSEQIVVQEDFVVPIPNSMNLAEAAPLLCAGITLYSPLKHWQAGPGKKVGIIGVGGLGHMGIKIAKAMGAEVSAITRSAHKADAAKEYGADKVIVSSDADMMENYAQYFDLLLDTAPGKHDLKPYIDLLGLHGSLVLVGPVSTMFDFEASDILANRRSIAGSGIGSIAETIEMLEFCETHSIYPTIEIISPEKISEAWQSMISGKMDHRYVIDLKKVS